MTEMQKILQPLAEEARWLAPLIGHSVVRLHVKTPNVFYKEIKLFVDSYKGEGAERLFEVTNLFNQGTTKATDLEGVRKILAQAHTYWFAQNNQYFKWPYLTVEVTEGINDVFSYYPSDKDGKQVLNP